jgi:hypothetical protein
VEGIEHREGIEYAGLVLARVTISVAFGCPFERAVPPERVLAPAGEAVTRDADEILFADTIGVATPTQVRAIWPSRRSKGRDRSASTSPRRARPASRTRGRRLSGGATVFDVLIGVAERLEGVLGQPLPG